MNFKLIDKVIFPTYSKLNVNMMSIMMGDPESIPNNLKKYIPMINQCPLEKGTTVYLTVHESNVEEGKTQRRPGIHTDATSTSSWGGGSWGGKEGIYLASTDGTCQVWDTQTKKVDYMGSLKFKLISQSEILKPNHLYWMSDRTPHESLPVKSTKVRQFFRLVGKDIGIWYSNHSTANPLGIKPQCLVSNVDKFK